MDLLKTCTCIMFMVLASSLEGTHSACNPACTGRQECLNSICYCKYNYGGAPDCPEECYPACPANTVCIGSDNCAPCPSSSACPPANGNCRALDDQVTCACKSGFTGADCQDCRTDVGCNNHGTCNTGSNTCSCDTNYVGSNCHHVCPNCLNNGRCVTQNNNAVCDCSGTGYVGDTCHLKCPDCQNGGVCVENSAGTAAECDCTGTGYGGATCNLGMSGSVISLTLLLLVSAYHFLV